MNEEIMQNEYTKKTNTNKFGKFFIKLIVALLFVVITTSQAPIAYDGILYECSGIKFYTYCRGTQTTVNIE